MIEKESGMSGPCAEPPGAHVAFLSGMPVAVEPQQIERELAALWKPASDAQGGEGAVTRACLANLVVHAGADRDLERAERAVAELARRHPNRTVLLIATSGDPAGALRATVSAACHAPAAGAAPVCCELIRLTAPVERRDLFRGAVAPLLVADLPVFLWWMGDPGDPLLIALAAHADRVLVDSREAPSTRGALRSMRDLTERPEVRDLIDLAWRSLAPWRRALADAFDEPAARGLLRRIARVELAVGGAPPAGGAFGSAALLLAGWIVSRLGWTVGEVEADARALRIACGRPGPPPAEVALIHEPTDGAAPANGRQEPTAARFLASSATGAPQVGIEIARETASTARVVGATDPARALSRVVPFRRPGDVELIGEVLDRPAYTGVFRDALDCALRIAEEMAAP